MKTRNHPLEQEELMAYLDGELPPEKAAQASSHLETCAECRNLAADLQGVSRRLMEWQVEAPETFGRTAIDAALAERQQKSARKSFIAAFFDVIAMHPWRMGGIAAATAVLVAAIVIPNLRNTRMSAYEAKVEKTEPWPQAANAPSQTRGDAVAPASPAVTVRARQDKGALADRRLAKDEKNDANQVASGLSASETTSTHQPPNAALDNLILTTPGAAAPQGAGRVADSGAGAGAPAPSMQANQPRPPMIVHTAQLSLVSRNFDQGRQEIEEILKRYGGYVGSLEVNAPTDSGRTLNATLRVPAARLQEILAELRKLGRVTAESQSGQEVTQQYVDLEARLANARNTEQRLKELLRDRTGKLKDVLEVEKEIGETRESIETMEAERKNLGNRVDYATLTLSLTEEYKAELQVVPVSTWTRISNAAVEGYHNLVEGLIEVLLFIVSAGPSLLVWGLALFFPARWTWRKFRQRSATV